MGLSPGEYLRTVRETLGVGMREVQEASMVIAAEEGNENFYVSPARLTQIENEESVPSFYKLSSLCQIYGLDLNDVLSRYGVRRSIGSSLNRRKFGRALPGGKEEQRKGGRPGLLLRSIAETLCSKRTYEIVAKPAIADMQYEHSVAASNGAKGKALVIRVAGTWSFWKAIIVAEFLQRLKGNWRRSTPGT
jgi:hypothetical protein